MFKNNQKLPNEKNDNNINCVIKDSDHTMEKLFDGYKPQTHEPVNKHGSNK